ncbi:hypothetical protein OA238_118p0210 (plasmid) [Octadecabacter arcticus 238]|uniref:Sel1 repeat family protein n=1 Tax=Octadecabacter arcticus 238 TaxID=391616 RepID=M9RXT2_9RHOB|nr:hypothetical protein OA238_118p0210 [Octadecabacter arcticus 238]
MIYSYLRIKCCCPLPSWGLAGVLVLTLAQPLLAREAVPASSDPFRAAVQAVTAGDFFRANELFLMLAEQDDHEAQFNLAVLLRAGKGLPQNFVRALEWAWLAQLGGVTRAPEIADSLIDKVLPATQADIASRIDTRLRGRLSRGDREAIMQFVVFNRTILERPDLETAYIWSLIGAALGVQLAIEARDEISTELEARIILSAQDMAHQMFLDQNMGSLFSSNPLAVR